MTKKENENLKHALYKLAGKIARLEQKGSNEEVTTELFKAGNMIVASVDLDFTEIQIEYAKDHKEC